MTDKKLVETFFIEGYRNRNFDFVMDCMTEDYYDHSPAAARSNADAVGILKIVADQYPNMEIEILDLFGENGMVATRIRFEGTHSSGKRICFEALENFKVDNGKINESWGYWPDKQIEEMLR